MYERLGQRCTGMEFATELIIKASLRGEKIAEVPITLCPDKHTSHAPHLKTFRDGWRTFRYFLMCSPRWLFLVPGGVFIAFGLLGYLVAMPGLRIGHSTFDAHTLLFASLAILCGYQCILFAIFAKTFATTEGLFLPPDQHLERFLEVVEFGKRTGRRGVGGDGWWQLVCHGRRAGSQFVFGIRNEDGNLAPVGARRLWPTRVKVENLHRSDMLRAAPPELDSILCPILQTFRSYGAEPLRKQIACRTISFQPVEYSGDVSATRGRTDLHARPLWLRDRNFGAQEAATEDGRGLPPAVTGKILCHETSK